MLDEAGGRVVHRWIDVREVEHLGEEPLRRVDPAAVLGVVGVVLVRLLGDELGFRVAGVILPEPGHRVRVVLELVVECEGHAGNVDRHRGAAGGVDTDADDPVGTEPRLARRVLDRTPDRRLQALDVVGGVLAGEVGVALVEDDAVAPPDVVVDVRADLLPGFDIRDQRADGIGAVVYSKCKLAI